MCHVYATCIVTTRSISLTKSTTVCRGSDVTINCDYQLLQGATTSRVTWRINGTLYKISTNPTDPWHDSLTIFSINYFTTVQCMRVDSSSSVTQSTDITEIVTVTTGTYVAMYIRSYVYT